MTAPKLEATPPGRRIVQQLRELHAITSVAGGAQRLAWTPEWLKARNWVHEQLAGQPVHLEQDEAGNVWAYPQQRSAAGRVVLGSHLDSVPNGGWLDGSLGVVTAAAILRVALAEGWAERLAVVDWADEEGARFGHSLFGSSAATGLLDPAEVATLRDRGGVVFQEALAAHGVDLATASRCQTRLDGVTAYLELHIEQGPVLDDAEIPVGVVTGTMGLRRHAVTFLGQAAHAGATPMRLRRDAAVAAARLMIVVRDDARALGGVATCGNITVEPGIATAVPGRAAVLLDQRHTDRKKLVEMWDRAQAAARSIAAEEGVSLAVEIIQCTEPVAFDGRLIELAASAVENRIGTAAPRLPSGALHDATAVATAGVPTIMLFARSLRGLSHTAEEDSREEDLIAAIDAFTALAHAVVDEFG